MTYRILAPASAELEEAVAWYNEQQGGLGYDLADEFFASLDVIADWPDAWPIFAGPMRRFRLPRFPYGVLYHVHDRTIVVIGFMHLAMEPRSWQKRAQSR